MNDIDDTYPSTIMSGHQAGVKKHKRTDSTLKITIPAQTAVPAIEGDFSDSSDEITADPQAELEESVAKDDEWTPPPVSSISKAPASKKPRKSTKDVVQEFDNGGMDDLGLDPFVWAPDIEMTAASPVSPVMEAPSAIPK